MTSDLPMTLPQIEAEQAEVLRLIAENRAALEQLQQRVEALHDARLRADGERDGIQADAMLAVDDAVEYGTLQRTAKDSLTRGDLRPAFRRFVRDLARLHGVEPGQQLARMLTAAPGTDPTFDALLLLAHGEAR